MTSTSTVPPRTPTSVQDAISPADRVIGVATIAGPLLMLASTVAWIADARALQAILLMWAMIGFGLLLVGFSQRLRSVAPAGSAAVLALGVVAACAGAGYAIEAAMVDHFGVERLNDQQTAATVLALQMPGLTFPLSMVLAAILSLRARLSPPVLLALLAVGAAGFPASRIPEVPELALVADALLCAALVPIGIAIVRGRTLNTGGRS